MTGFITLVVNNKSGVLARVCGIIHRYGANIELLEARPGSEPSSSELSMTLTCDEPKFELMIQRVRSLVDVKDASTRPSSRFGTVSSMFRTPEKKP